MASQCECNDGDPFAETQEGRNVLGFFVGEDKYKQANYVAPFAGPSAVGSYYYAYLDKRDVEDTTKIGYYHRFQLDATVFPISTMTESIEILELSFQILSKDAFQLNQQYSLNGMLPEGLLPENRSRVGISFKDHLRPLPTDGSIYVRSRTSAKSRYVEFTKFEIPNKPERNIASGYFELYVDIDREDGTVEEVKLTGGVFDVSM
jgi:hypothetical protein